MQIGSKKWNNVIYDGARELGIQIDRGKIDQFGIHAFELIKKKVHQEQCFHRLQISVY